MYLFSNMMNFILTDFDVVWTEFIIKVVNEGGVLSRVAILPLKCRFSSVLKYTLIKKILPRPTL